jgi:hypothetical protein
MPLEIPMSSSGGLVAPSAVFSKSIVSSIAVPSIVAAGWTALAVLPTGYAVTVLRYEPTLYATVVSGNYPNAKERDPKCEYQCCSRES